MNNTSIPPVPTLDTKATAPTKTGAKPPKKPAKKVAKSWPSVNALLTTLSITATLGGWAYFTVQDQSATFVETAAVELPPALIETSLPAETSIYTLTLDLPPIPTVVPPPALVAPAPNNASAPSAAPPQAPIAPPVRSVTAPPPAVSAPPAAAPAPAATTRSSR